MRGQEREDVGSDVGLGDAIGGKLAREDRVATDALEVPATGSRTDEHGPDAPPPRSARSSTSRPFSGASRATLSTATSSSPSPSAARSSERLSASVSARPIQAATSIVFAKTRTRAGSAPSATTDSCASVPTTSTDAARRTIGGTAVVFTSRRQPAFGPASWLSTSRTYGTRRRRHHAIDAWEANVLQPETTTTSGFASASVPRIPSVIG